MEHSSLDYDTKTNQLLSRAEEGRNILIENGATLIEVKGIHNKSLAIDNHTLIEGSFNWLSANRHKEYSRHECSIVVPCGVSAEPTGRFLWRG